MPATLIPAADAPRFEADGFTLTGLAAPSRGCATVSAWRLTAAPGAQSTRSSSARASAWSAAGPRGGGTDAEISAALPS